MFKRSNSPEAQEVILPDALRVKLDKFYRWKRHANQSVAPEAPLFMSRRKRRLSKRQVRHTFHVWQERTGFERRFCFHTLRHYADSRVMPTRVSDRTLNAATAAAAFRHAA